MSSASVKGEGGGGATVGEFPQVPLQEIHKFLQEFRRFIGVIIDQTELTHSYLCLLCIENPVQTQKLLHT